MRASYLRSGGSLALPTTLNCKKAISRLVPKAQARFRFVTASGRLITKLRFLGKKYIKLQGLCAALLRFASKAARHYCFRKLNWQTLAPLISCSLDSPQGDYFEMMMRK